MCNVGVEERSPAAQLLQRRFLEYMPAGKAGTPDLPERMFPDHLMTIKMQTLFSLVRDSLLPALAFLRGDIGVCSNHGAQHIQVVDLAERVLQLAEIFRPLLVSLGQKVFHRVTESLDSNS